MTWKIPSVRRGECAHGNELREPHKPNSTICQPKPKPKPKPTPKPKPKPAPNPNPNRTKQDIHQGGRTPKGGGPLPTGGTVVQPDRDRPDASTNDVATAPKNPMPHCPIPQASPKNLFPNSCTQLLYPTSVPSRGAHIQTESEQEAILGTGCARDFVERGLADGSSRLGRRRPEHHGKIEREPHTQQAIREVRRGGCYPKMLG